MKTSTMASFCRLYGSMLSHPKLRASIFIIGIKKPKKIKRKDSNNSPALNSATEIDSNENSELKNQSSSIWTKGSEIPRNKVSVSRK